MNDDKKISINKQTFENIVLDWKKHKPDPIERARLLKEAMNTFGYDSIRSMAKILGMPKSTLQDWIMWDNLTPEQYDKYKEEGYNNTMIYRDLRSAKQQKLPLIEKKILEANKIITPFITEKHKSHNAIQLAKELLNNVNRLIINLEKEVKQ